MQVLGNPEIAVCEQNDTAGNGSEMMMNGTTGSGEGDVACVTCGKLYPEYYNYTLCGDDNQLTTLHVHTLQS